MPRSQCQTECFSTWTCTYSSITRPEGPSHLKMQHPLLMLLQFLQCFCELILLQKKKTSKRSLHQAEPWSLQELYTFYHKCGTTNKNIKIIQMYLSQSEGGGIAEKARKTQTRWNERKLLRKVILQASSVASLC